MHVEQAPRARRKRIWVKCGFCSYSTPAMRWKRVAKACLLVHRLLRH